jgi:hypothetical protein
VGDILGAIFGWFSGLGNFLEGLAQLWSWLLKLLSGIVQLMQRIWDFIVKRLLAGILDALRAAAQWLEARLQPIIDFLTRLRALLQRLFNTYVRPVLIVLQRIRQFVHLLALLHVHIAQRLDAFLAKLQGKIIQGFYTVTAAINTLTQILLALEDPEYLIKHPVLLLSIRRQIPALIQAATGRPPGYWFPSPRGAAGGVFAPPAIPFTYASPGAIAPASALLTNDGLPSDLSGVVNCYEYVATAVDQVAPLDYFNPDLYPDTLCPYNDPARCLLYSWGISG